jgi:hypothetical protein
MLAGIAPLSRKATSRFKSSRVNLTVCPSDNDYFDGTAATMPPYFRTTSRQIQTVGHLSTLCHVVKIHMIARIDTV